MGRASFFWNLLCCPIVGTVGLLLRSIQIYVVPCATVLCQRCAVGCLWRYLCCCIGWPYEDSSFYGASALGDHEGKQSSVKMNADTDWVRAHELKQFQGKTPQLFEGKIEPNDLCQGAVGDCWYAVPKIWTGVLYSTRSSSVLLFLLHRLVAAFACASK